MPRLKLPFGPFVLPLGRLLPFAQQQTERINIFGRPRIGDLHPGGSPNAK
jgi:hypothetical protein